MQMRSHDWLQLYTYCQWGHMIGYQVPSLCKCGQQAQWKRQCNKLPLFIMQMRSHYWPQNLHKYLVLHELISHSGCTYNQHGALSKDWLYFRVNRLTSDAILSLSFSLKWVNNKLRTNILTLWWMVMFSDRLSWTDPPDSLLIESLIIRCWV